MNQIPRISVETVERIAARLAPTGLNRCQAASVNDLPTNVWLGGAEPRSLEPDMDGHATLLLVGHGGRELWDYLHTVTNSTDRNTNSDGFDFHKTTDPIDTFSIVETEAALEAETPNVGRRLLYPHPECPVDLVALGSHLGWQTTSPLGLGISTRYGLWSAFRALWSLDATVQTVSRVPSPDLCQSCVPRSCVDECPANAVEVGRPFSVSSCIDYRSEFGSKCAETCLSRRACPVGVEHRYGEAQMAYHYRLSRPPVNEG